MFFDLYDAFTPIGHIHALASALVAFGLLPGALTLVFLALFAMVAFACSAFDCRRSVAPQRERRR